jgi:hypothetical protein
MDADAAFTERLYAEGVKGAFDAWSIHPYSGDRSPLDPGPDGVSRYSFTDGVPAVRAAMLAQGDRKPLWLTEFGWSTAAVRGRAPWENGVGPRAQARYLSQAFALMRSWPYVHVGMWYDLADTSRDPQDRVGHYGLLGADGRPKPAWAAFRWAARAP